MYQNLGTLFQHICHENVDRVALEFTSHTVSYAALHELSDGLAKMLVSVGIAYGDVVAIFNSKSQQGYALMLACLRIGAIYVNLDEDSPMQRLRQVLDVAKPSLVVADHTSQLKLIDAFGEEYSTLSIADLDLVDTPEAELPAIHTIDGDAIAYLMFTSGSTGTPKGVVIRHQSVLNFIAWSETRFDVNNTDVFAQLSPLYFDNSVFDFYTALFSGARLVPISKAMLNNPPELVRYVSQKQCSIWFSVPSLYVYLLTMRCFNQDYLQSIRYFVFGGEGFPKVKLKQVFDLYKESAKFVNVYGPTEGTCICSSYNVRESDFDNIDGILPLGDINPNFRYIILNENESPQSQEELRGELCLLGPNLAVGYYNARETTERAFVSNPKQKAYSEIMYKTGDLVKFSAKQALLEFIGRKDNQIKHMGYRIELDEIEAHVNKIDRVKESAVVYVKNKAGVGKICVAVALEETEGVDTKFINNFLKDRVPHYMLAGKVSVFDSLPKNPNGKIDRKHLQSIDEFKV